MVEFSEDLKGSIAHSNKMRKSMMSSGSFANKSVSSIDTLSKLFIKAFRQEFLFRPEKALELFWPSKPHLFGDIYRWF